MTPQDRAEFSQQLAERRKRGRPAAANKITVKPTSVRIPDPVFAALCQVAKRERVSLHRLMNAALVSYLRDCRQAQST